MPALTTSQAIALKLGITCLILTLIALAAAHPRCPDAGNLKTIQGVASYARKYINNGRCPQLSYCRNVDKPDQLEGDVRLVELQNKHFQRLKSLHLPFAYKYRGASDACWLVQDGFVTLYSTSKATPIFTAERLERSTLIKKMFTKKDTQCFRLDPRLDYSKETFKCDSYKSASKDPLVPAADLSYGFITQLNSFIFSNLAPMHARIHKQVQWKKWEMYTKGKVLLHRVLYAITGVTTDNRSPHKAAQVGDYYKLLVWCDHNNKVSAEYVLLRHVNRNPKEIHRSTEKGMTLTQLQNSFRIVTGISIDLANYQCTPPTSGVLKSILQKISKPALTLKNIKKRVGHYMKPCTLINKALSQLVKQGKLQFVSTQQHSILDESKEHFRTKCKSTSEALYYGMESIEDMTYEKFADLDLDLEKSSQVTHSARVLTGKTFKLFDLLNIPRGIDVSAVNFKLQNITYKCGTKELDIHTAPSNVLTLIPGVLKIRDGVVSLRMNFGSKRFQTNVVAFTGECAIGSIAFNVRARYDTKEKLLLFKGSPSVKMPVDLKNEIDSLTGTLVPIPLSSKTLTNIEVVGSVQFVKGGLATIVATGSIGRIKVYAIFQKPLKAGKFTGAFAADIGPFKLANIIRKAAEVDISRIPFLGSLVIPQIGLTIASDYITSSMLEETFCQKGLLNKLGITIPKGLQAIINVKLSGRKVTFNMRFFQSLLTMKVAKGSWLPIGSLLSKIPGINIRSLSLPKGIKDIVRLQVNDFFLDTRIKELKVDTSFPKTLKYFNGYLTIINPALSLHVVLRHPRKLSVEVDGSVKIGKGDHVITIKRDKSLEKYILEAHFKTVPISDIIRKFSAKLLPRLLQRSVAKFTHFSIHNARLRLPLGVKNLQLHLSGTPVIHGFKTVHLSAVIIRQNKETKLIWGFELGKVSLASLVQQITKKDLRKIAILNQELNIAVLISPTTLPSVHLHGNLLKHTQIKSGITINAALHWPKNCAADKFCAVAQKLLGTNARLSLQARIHNTNTFTMSAVVSDVRLGSGVVLQRAALEVTTGLSTSVGIEGTIHLKNPGIKLIASVRVDVKRGVVLQGNMQGCWKRAFGAKWLSICNLHLLIGIKPSVTLIGALEIGGEIRLGNSRCTSHPITALGYLGIDQLSPQDNFYYVELKNKVTVMTVLRAFCIKFPLPRPIAESGFPKGFLSSFSIAGKELSKIGLKIPAGFRLKGTINILGLVAHADVLINLPKTVKFYIGLGPLRIGKGILKMYASSRDRSRGPFLKVFIQSYPQRKVDIHASGFVSVLGIHTEAMLRITNTQYQFAVRGKFLHLFQASLHITSHYGSIKKANFRVRGKLKNDFFVKIRRKIVRGLQNSARAATKAIDNAKRKVNAKKVVFDRAIRKLTSAQHRVNRANRAWDRAINKLRRWESKVHRLCRIRRCRSICIGCPGPWRCWKRIRIWRKRRCVLKKPTWRRCCKRITDPICKVRNGVCKGLRKIAIAGLRLARILVNKSRFILKAANVFLGAAKVLVRIGKKSLDIVNAILEGVKIAYQAGTKALAAIAKFTLGGIFDIREVAFDVGLSTAVGAHFRVSIVVSIFNHLKRLSLYINLRNILSFVRSIGQRIIRGLKKFIF